MHCIYLFPVYPEIFPIFSYERTSQHSKLMDSLNVDWSSGWISSCFFGSEGKIHKPKPWTNRACKEIHTATLGMKLTSVVCKFEIKINIIKVKSEPSPLFHILIHYQMCNLALIQNQYPPRNVESRPTPNRYASPARTWSRGLQHVNWVCRPLQHQSLTPSW